MDICKIIIAAEPHCLGEAEGLGRRQPAGCRAGSHGAPAFWGGSCSPWSPDAAAVWWRLWTWGLLLPPGCRLGGEAGSGAAGGLPGIHALAPAAGFSCGIGIGIRLGIGPQWWLGPGAAPQNWCSALVWESLLNQQTERAKAIP